MLVRYNSFFVTNKIVFNTKIKEWFVMVAGDITKVRNNTGKMHLKHIYACKFCKLVIFNAQNIISFLHHNQFNPCAAGPGLGPIRNVSFVAKLKINGFVNK